MHLIMKKEKGVVIRRLTLDMQFQAYQLRWQKGESYRRIIKVIKKRQYNCLRGNIEIDSIQ
jgi:hypothetical protein